jgi:alpha-L-fucosidase
MSNQLYSITRVLIFLFFLGSGIMPVKAQQYEPTWASLDKRPIPQWFEDAKFGIFIHWGVYSVPAYRPVSNKMYETYAEWYGEQMYKPGGLQDFHNRVFGKNFDYRSFGPLFKAELFEPERWAGLFERAGARYVVLTSKHHDGFALWPSKSPYSKNWNSMDVGPKRDLLGDLSKAVRAKGLRMGLYYSLMEWESVTRKDGKYYIDKAMWDKYRIPDPKYVDDHMLPQLKELVMNYQPSLIFADGEWDQPAEYWKSQEFLAWLYNNAPNKNEVIVNDRWDVKRGQHGGYFTSEYNDHDGAMGAEHPWEESRGMGQSYGFNRAENIDDYQTSAALIGQLINIVSRGGNLLLNIGPAADGTIPVIMQQRLVDIGDWLKINGEAIYGTRAWANTPGKVTANSKSKVYYTTKGKDLYVLCTEWPTEIITIDKIKASKDTKVSMLGVAASVKPSVKDGKLSFSAPLATPADVKGKYAYVFKVENVL